MPLRTYLHRAGLILLGLLLGLVLLEIGLRIGGFLWLGAQARRNLAATETGGARRILCIGESTTAFGEETSYPRLLDAFLDEQIGRDGFSVINAGIPRTTTDAILQQLPAWLDQHRPDTVVAMIGINDRKYLLLPEDEGLTGLLQRLQVVKLAGLLADHLTHREETPPKPGVRAREETLARARAAIAADPTDVAAHIAASNAGPRDQRHATFAAAEKALREAIERNPEDPGPRDKLAELYLHWSRAADAQEVLEEALDAGAANRETERLLLRTFRIRLTGALFWARLPEAERLARALLDRLPENAEASRADVLATLGSIARRRGDLKAAEQYASEARRLRAGRSDERTRANYRAIADLLEARGVRLVAVQYPMRSTEPLLRQLDGATVAAFVDNEAAFQEAVRAQGFGKIFSDSFAGDFGHLTEPGRRLLAARIGAVLLEEVYDESGDQGRSGTDDRASP